MYNSAYCNCWTICCVWCIAWAMELEIMHHLACWKASLRKSWQKKKNSDYNSIPFYASLLWNWIQVFHVVMLDSSYITLAHNLWLAQQNPFLFVLCETRQKWRTYVFKAKIKDLYLNMSSSVWSVGCGFLLCGRGSVRKGVDVPIRHSNAQVRAARYKKEVN